MKTLIPVLCTITLLVVNCSKSTETIAPSLYGTWKETTKSITNCTTSAQNIAEGPCTNCVTLVLATGANNINTWTSTSGPSSGTWGAGGPITNATGIINFMTSGSLAVVTVSYIYTASTLELVTDNGSPGPLCRETHKYTRQ